MQLIVEGVGHSYADIVALDGIHLTVREGEILALIGPSGCGKSTMLGIMGGILAPSAGRVLVAGEPPAQCLNPFTYVFQDFALLPWRSVEDNVALPLEHHAMSGDERARRVSDVLARTGLTEFRAAYPKQLSGGMRQRVGIARALAVNPAILLMDEPLSALDKKLREQMQVELRHLHRRIETTTVYVTHDQREALTLSDRIAVMNQGKIAQIGTPNTIYERPEDLFVADFMGDSQFIRVEMASAQDARFNGTPLRIGHVSPKVQRGGFLLLRPEKLELLLPGDSPDGMNAIPCAVQEIIYQGDQVMVVVRLDSGDTIMVRRGTGEQAMRRLPQAGARIALGLHPKDSIVMADG